MTLDNSCTSRVPKWPKIRPPTATTIRRGYTDEWFALCKASSVGEYEPGKSFGAYGSRRNKTVARDCQKEIESAKQPNIPFAKDTVYLPFPERTHWPFQATGGLSEIPEEKESSSEGQALVETTGNDRAKGRLPRNVRKEEPRPTLKENKEPIQETETVRRAVDKPPTRMRAVRKISNPGRVTAATAATVPLRVPRDSRTLQRTKPAKEAEVPVQEALPLRTVKSTPPTVESSEPLPAKQQSTIRVSGSLRSISSELPSSDPASVLVQLQTFRDNVTRALQRKPSRSRSDKAPQLPFVSKWVDYSRKHGVGFVLEDGTVGCLTVATDKYPVMTAVVQEGHSHLSKVAKDPSHLSQVPIEYFAASREMKGLSRVEVTERHRREHLQMIWHKFGKYMCVQLGMEERHRKKTTPLNNIVKFYQRLGSVGFWGFGDGSFQV